MNYSLTQGGNLAAFIGVILLVLNHFNINIAQDEIEVLIGGIVAVVGIATSWYGRWRKGDLKLGGARR